MEVKSCLRAIRRNRRALKRALCAMTTPDLSPAARQRHDRRRRNAEHALSMAEDDFAMMMHTEAS